MASSHYMNTELSQFVREALLKNKTRAEIKQALKLAQWQDDEIKTALDAYADQEFSIPVPKRTPYLSAGEAFKYLVLFLTLYCSAISLGTILFQAVNRNFIDIISGGYMAIDDTTITGTIRFATAMLVVAFPIFFWISYISTKAMLKNPDKRSSRVRKWLTYITLFIASGVIIGDSITLVYNFLSGELTTRFILKCIIVGIITGCIFGYYLLDLRGEEEDNNVLNYNSAGFKIFLSCILALIISTLIYGFSTAGSPAKERAKRFDDTKVNDLQQIQNAVNIYYQTHANLPESLEQLKTEPNIYLQSIQDPESKIQYEYRILTSSAFEVCTNFHSSSTQSLDGQSKPYANGQPFWDHAQGHVCYTIKTPILNPAPYPAPLYVK